MNISSINSQIPMNSQFSGTKVAVTESRYSVQPRGMSIGTRAFVATGRSV